MLTKKTTTETEYSSRSNGASRAQTPTPTASRQPTQEQIARRAYEISKSGTGGSPEENWYRAERELRARA